MSDDSVTTYSAGDTTWMLVSIALVMMMTPALALFEAGLLRSKNTISIVMQCWTGLCVLSALWYMIGFTLCFGEDQGGIIGNFDYFFFMDVHSDELSTFAPTIPATVFASFQMMFAVITPLLLTGAFAERLKFKPYVWFIVIWSIVCYYPICHWVWGGGWIGEMGAWDFAGGIAIHVTAGGAALVMGVVLPKRPDMHNIEPHSIPLAVTGGALLWMGWFGFNGGSALATGASAAAAVINSHIGSATSGCVWIFASWYRHGTSSLVEAVNGSIAGLAGITPAAGYIHSQSAFVLGIILGLSSFGGVILIKEKWHVDDALDVSSVHGITGLVGSIAIGFIASDDILPGGPNGIFFGDDGTQLGHQIVACLVVGVYSVVVTYGVLKFIDRFCAGGLCHEVEDTSLDRTEHNEKAYSHHAGVSTSTSVIPVAPSTASNQVRPADAPTGAWDATQNA